jgi:putative glutamine amidotransferase
MLDIRPSGPVPPFVVVTGHRRFGFEVQRLPVFIGHGAVEVYLSPYVRSVARANGAPVLMTREADAAAVVDRLDGLVLAGGEDVDSRLYGGVPPASATYIDPGRDEKELALLKAAVAKGIPVLGICRGLQLINVARGGPLLTDLTVGTGESHTFFGYPEAQRTHEVEVEPSSTLSSLFGTRVRVNSYHHQAADRPGDGVEVVARADDGAVEAIEVPKDRMLAVQWHPEMFGAAPVFGWLVDQATGGCLAAVNGEQRVRERRV